jgi:DNA polymerase-1
MAMARPKKGGQGLSATEKLEIVLKRLDAEKDRCYDCETSGLDWRYNHIVGHVLSFGPDPKDSYYLPFRHAGTGNIGGVPGPEDPHGWDGKLHPGEVELIKKLDKPGTTLFGHNLAFDLKFLYRWGYRFHPRNEDTMINAPLLNELQPKFTLEYCAQQAGVFAKLSKEIVDHIRSKFPEAPERGAMGYYYRLDADDPMTVEYAEGDGTSTWQLRDWQMKQIREPDSRGRTIERVWDIESRMIPILARMTTRGIKIDVARLEEIKSDVEKNIERLKNDLPEDFNSRSPNDVKAWLESNGVTNWPLTPTGKPSFPEKFLLKSEAGRAVVDIRRYSTLESSFITPMSERHLWNGRVHSEYNQLRGDEYGTITGRLSSNNPNLQQVPKRNVELGRIFRSIFIPDDGMTWGSVDFSQCEPRLLAYYSGTRVLVDGYLSQPPVDAHTSVTIATNPDWEELDKAERKARREIGKRVNQTILTGGGARALGEYGVEEPERIMREYFDRMPEIKDLQRNAASTYKARGYVLSLLGRRSHLADRNKAYVAVNRLLQCGNADIIKLKMVEIDTFLEATGRTVDLLNNVHDALDYQFPEDQREIYQQCLNIMTSFGPDDAICMPVETWDDEAIARAKAKDEERGEGDPAWAVPTGKYTIDGREVYKVPLPMEIEAGEGPNWAVATYGPEE